MITAQEMARMSVFRALASVGREMMKIRVATPVRNWPMIALARRSRSVRASTDDIISRDRPVVVRLAAMSEETLRKLAMQVRNWGRWGAADEIGTLNFITPEAVAAACRLATTGKVFALGIPLQREGPQSGTRQRFNPIHTMFRDGGDQPRTPAEVVALQGYGGSDDWIVMPLQCVTQWDSLAHVFYEGKMYNGYDAALVTSNGTSKNSIDKTKSRIAGRGVLLDVARWKGVRALSPDTRSRRPISTRPPRPRRWRCAAATSC